MKILIAEDDTSSRLLFSATLKKLGYAVTAVEDGHKAWEAWQQEAPTLLISDWMMPGINGLDLCRRIRRESDSVYTYIILLSSMDSKGSYLEGMDAGADDFITKPFDEEYLASRLRVAERILGLHEKLRREAYDRLTGIWNRAAIIDHMQRELARAKRQNFPIGVVLADLDHFKRVNDTYGHPAGDKVLQEAARRMQEVVRPYDRVGRYGGEEFLIISPACDRNQAIAIAERVRCSIEEKPFNYADESIAMTASLGVTISCNERDTIGALIIAADTALYRAKNSGRNQVDICITNSGDQLTPPME